MVTCKMFYFATMSGLSILIELIYFNQFWFGNEPEKMDFCVRLLQTTDSEYECSVMSCSRKADLTKTGKFLQLITHNEHCILQCS